MCGVALVKAGINDVMIGGQQVLQGYSGDHILAGPPFSDLRADGGACCQHALDPAKGPALMPPHLWIKSWTLQKP